MKKILNYCVPHVLAIICLVVIYLFRVQLLNTVWADYRMLAIPTTVSEQTVLIMLKDCSIDRVLSISTQPVLYTNPLSPVIPLCASYNDALESYFYDESGKYGIYYLEQAKNLSKNLSVFWKNADDSWRLEDVSPFMYFLLLIPVSLTAAFGIFSKRRFLYAAFQFPVLFVAFCSPVFATAACASVMPLFAFFIQHFWKKPGWNSYIASDLSIIFLAIALFFLPVTCGLKIILLEFCAYFASACFVRVYYYWDMQPAGLKYIFINSAQACAFPRKTRVQICLLAAISSGILAVPFSVKDHFLSAGGLNGLSIPVPAEYTRGSKFTLHAYENLVTAESSQRQLPDLGDYITYRWKTDIYPYVSLHSALPPAYTGSVVGFPSYRYDEKAGQTEECMKELFAFDEEYFLTVFETFKNESSLKKLSVERLLYDQKRFVTVAYKKLR